LRGRIITGPRCGAPLAGAGFARGRAVPEDSAIYHVGRREEAGGRLVHVRGCRSHDLDPSRSPTRRRHRQVRAAPASSARRHGPKTLAGHLRARRRLLPRDRGTAQVLAACVTKVERFQLEEFGVPEALLVIDVKDLPVVVTMDSALPSLHAEVEQARARGSTSCSPVGVGCARPGNAGGRAGESSGLPSSRPFLSLRCAGVTPRAGSAPRRDQRLRRRPISVPPARAQRAQPLAEHQRGKHYRHHRLGRWRAGTRWWVRCAERAKERDGRDHGDHGHRRDRHTPPADAGQRARRAVTRAPYTTLPTHDHGGGGSGETSRISLVRR